MQFILNVDAKLYEQLKALANAEGLSMPNFLTCALREAVNRRSSLNLNASSGAYGKGGLQEEISGKTIDELIDATYEQ